MFLRQTKSKVADPSGSGYSDLEEWVLDTEGVNLAEVQSCFLSWLFLDQGRTRLPGVSAANLNPLQCLCVTQGAGAY